MLPLSTPKEGLKGKTAIFRLKLHFSEKKSATKFLSVKTVSDMYVCCYAFIGLSIRAK